MEELKVGCKLKIFADDGVYEGLLHAVDLKGTGKDDRVTLIKATCLSTGRPVPRLIHFYTTDIKKFEIVSASKLEATTVGKGEKLVNLCPNMAPPHLKKLTNIDQEKLSFSWKLGTGDKQKNSELCNGSKDKHDKETTQCLKKDENSDTSDIEYTLIDTIDQTFHDAIILLKRHTVIGLTVQGISISRQGKLCWLQIGIKNHSILFDIIALSQAAFDLGLRDVLESPLIQKVVYNCRCMSDILCHQYNVLLTNIFDIQVAEVTAFAASNGGNLPWYVNSLPACLMENLMLNEDEVFFQRARVFNKEKDESVWAHRPATDEMLDAACKNVKYLCSLRCIMIEKLLRDFICGTDIYLGALRDIPDKDYAKTVQTNSDLLPNEFYRLDYKSYHKQSPSKSRFVENCLVDPVLQIRHDGISHGNRIGSTRDYGGRTANTRPLQRSKSVGATGRQLFNQR